MNEQPIHFQRPIQDIIVNGVILDRAELAREIQLHSANNFNEARQRAGQALVIRHLLREQVQAQLAEGLDEEVAIEALVARNLPEIFIDDEVCQRFYWQNPARFYSTPLMVIRHILLAVAKNDLKGRTEQKVRAEELLATIRGSDNVKSNFLAKVELSCCPSKKDGGLLGELSIGQTVPEFERQVFRLNEGLSPQLLETRYGYHIVFVDKKKEGQLLPLIHCLEKIRAYLGERRKRQLISDYLHQLTDNATIVGIQLQMEQENIVL